MMAMQKPNSIRTIIRSAVIAAPVIAAVFGIVFMVRAQDSVSPDPITTLAVSDQTSMTITLTWTATGDDGNSGQAASYDLRYSYVAIDDGTWVTDQQIATGLEPKSAGSVEGYTVTGLIPDESYTFALKVSDEEENESALSNVVTGSTDPLSGYRNPVQGYIDGDSLGNIVADSSSFETGDDNFSLSRLMSPSEYADGDVVYRPAVLDTTTSVHGATSLRIDNGSATDTQQDYVILHMNWQYLKAGEDYTFSYWAKTDDPTNSIVLKVSTTGGTSIINDTCSMTTTDWTHCVSTVTNVSASDDQLFTVYWTSGKNYYNNPPTSTGHGSIWLDAVQIEEGIVAEGDIVYDYPLDVGLGISANNDHPIYYTQDLEGGANVTATITTHLDTADGSSKDIDLRYQLVNGYGAEVLTGQESVSLLDETSGSTELNLTQLIADAHPGTEYDKGTYRLTVTAFETGANPGPILNWEEYVYGVIEQDTSGADPNSPFGTHFGDFPTESTIFGGVYGADPDYRFELADALGFKWLRDFSIGQWLRVQQNEEDAIAFNDPYVESAEANNLAVMPIIQAAVAPSWAYLYDEDSAVVRAHPYNPWNYYAQQMHDTDMQTTFVTALVDHYKSSISTWEISNEPSFRMLPEEYNDYFLMPVADAVRATDPTATIVGPDPGPHGDYGTNSIPYIQAVTALPGAVDRIDIASQHMYDWGGTPVDNPQDYQSLPYDDVIRYDVRAVNDALPGAELWDTESGFVEGTLYSKRKTFYGQGVLLGGVSGADTFVDSVSGNTESSLQYAQQRARQMLIKLGEGIDRIFEFRITAFANILHAGEFSLSDHDYTPETSLPALGALMTILDGADVDNAVNVPYDRLAVNDTNPLNDLLYSYIFPKGSNAVMTIWSAESPTEVRGVEETIATLDMDIDPTNVTAYDIFGNKVALADNGSGGALVPVSNSPLYIESSGVSGSYDLATFMALVASASSVLGLPDPPSDLRASPQASKTVNLTWIASLDPSVTGYNIYRIKSGQVTQTPSKRNSSLLTDTSFTDTGLSDAPNYAWWVVAVDGEGNESLGASTVMPSAWHDNIPTDLTEVSTTETTITISWTDDEGADSTSFQYRPTIDGVVDDRVTHVETDGYVYTYTFDHLTSDTEHTITLTANDAYQVVSAAAGTLTVTTDPLPDTTPPEDVDDLSAM